MTVVEITVFRTERAQLTEARRLAGQARDALRTAASILGETMAQTARAGLERASSHCGAPLAALDDAVRRDRGAVVKLADDLIFARGRRGRRAHREPDPRRRRRPGRRRAPADRRRERAPARARGDCSGSGSPSATSPSCSSSCPCHGGSGWLRRSRSCWAQAPRSTASRSTASCGGCAKLTWPAQLDAGRAYQYMPRGPAETARR